MLKTFGSIHEKLLGLSAEQHAILHTGKAYHEHLKKPLFLRAEKLNILIFQIVFLLSCNVFVMLKGLE